VLGHGLDWSPLFGEPMLQLCSTNLCQRIGKSWAAESCANILAALALAGLSKAKTKQAL
jgi:hypothetical protein